MTNGNGSRGFQPINIVFGILMGSADIVPGVSGGTVALIVGIYERLVASISAAASGAANLARGRVREATDSLRAIEWGLVIPLGIGIGIALVTGARIILPLLTTHPVETRAVFFGLIAGSLGVPWGRIRTHRTSYYAVALAAAVFAYLLVGIPPREVIDPAPPIVFLAAMIAICAMILPGISGSFLLVAMGMYHPTLEALNGLNIPYILVFCCGAALGIGSFSKILQFVLRTRHDLAMAALVGLMAGSLRALWPFQEDGGALLPPPSLAALLSVMALAVIGFLVVYGLTYFGDVVEARRAGLSAEER